MIRLEQRGAVAFAAVIFIAVRKREAEEDWSR
jgi:hypothetical protein